MFQRDIYETEVEDVIVNGEIIESYPTDKPYPSFLALGYFDGLALHVVYAKEEDDTAIIITAYRPSLHKWQNDFKIRKV
jgi:hypothetical protein